MNYKKVLLRMKGYIRQFGAHMAGIKEISSRRNFIPIVGTMCLLLVMTGVSFYAISGWEKERLSSDFESHSNQLANALQTEFSGHLDVLYSIISLYQSSSEVTREEFSTFVMPYLLRHPGIQALMWIPRVPDRERENFEETARLDGYYGFQITEYQNEQQVPAAQRDEYFPVYYVGSCEAVGSVLGLDMASEPNLLESLVQARDTGKAVATTHIDLMLGDEQQYGVYMCIPIYYGNSSPLTVGGRQELLTGFVSGVFRADRVVSSIMDTELYKGLSVELYDEIAPAGERLLYSSRPNAEYDEFSESIAQTITFEMAEHQWALRITPTRDYLAGSNSWYSVVFLFFGLLLTYLVGHFLFIRVRSTLSIEKLANELSVSNQELQEEVANRSKTEAELRASEEKYSQLVEQGNDGIIVIQDGQLVFANSKIREMTGMTEEEYMDKPFLDFLPPQYKDVVLERYEKRLTGEETPNRYEVEIPIKNGKTITVEVNAGVIDYKGKPADMAIIRDTTGRKRAQEALAEEATRRRILVDGSRDGIVVLEENGNVYEANKQFAEMLGYSPEEVKQLHVFDWEFLFPKEQVVEMIRTVDETGDHFETQHRRKDGTTFDVEISTNAAYFREQKLIFCVCRDITERKREEQLKQSENYVLTLLEQGAELSEVLDAIVYVGEAYNPSIKGSILLFDYSKQWLIHGSSPSLPDEFTAVLKIGVPVGPNMGSCGTAAYLRERVIVEDIANSPLFQTSPDAVKLATDCGLFASWSQPIFSSGGDLLGTIANYSNKVGAPYADSLKVVEWSARIAAIAIERKRVEEEIRVFSNAVAGAIDPISISDKRGTIKYVNSALEETYGYDKGELLGKYVGILNANSRITKKQNEGINKTGSWRGEIEAKRKNGEIFPAFLSLSTVRDDDGKFIAMLGASRDITKQKRIEEEKEDTAKKAYLSSRLAAVGQMAAGIAHEINNPLTGVIGFADLLMSRTDIPDDIREDLKIINDGAQRVSKIVKGMLTYARNSKTESEYADINEILETTITLRDYEMRTSDIKVKKHFDPELPKTMAASGQLQQVFLNLIINAEQAMKKAHGKGNLNITTEKVGEFIRISFKDDGSGIDKENIDRIFEPFFTTKRPGEGTGLGLSLCYGIVQEHNGQIYATSTKGKGATFIVEIPIVSGDVQPELQNIADKKGDEVKKNRILIVDDEVVVRHFLKRMLTEDGHEVETVDNAVDGLEKLREEYYDLILLDIKMPDISGIDLYWSIREMDESLAEKVVFITGDIMADDTRSFFSKTKVTHISKPFDNYILKGEIARHLTERKKETMQAGSA